MMTRTAAALAAAALCVTGCGFAMRSVPFQATPADWERLAGRWRGEYTMADGDRRGLIEFRLQAAPPEAFGEVLMIPDRSTRPTDVPDRQVTAATRPGADAQLLVIRFVAADARAIHGSIAPYWDPDRTCRASASFFGVVDGAVITGSFISTCEDGVRVLQGRWRVERDR